MSMWKDPFEPRYVDICGKRTLVHTTFEYPPIPRRDMDWSAITDDYDGAEDAHSPIGRGATEEEAIADLKRSIEESEDYEEVS